MGRVLNGIVFLIVAGFVVALMRKFEWDPFEAAQWAIAWVWDSIDRVADIWSSNDTFKEATEKPS
jgi:hypothetical protein